LEKGEGVERRGRNGDWVWGLGKKKGRERGRGMDAIGGSREEWEMNFAWEEGDCGEIEVGMLRGISYENRK
jgi:hypothetical protein